MENNIIKLDAIEYDSFPDEFNITQKVFEYYYDIGFNQQGPDSLNEEQLTLCFHFICEGLIDNSGFYSILLETNGEFDYSKALERVNDEPDRVIFDEIGSIYLDYKKWFSQQQLPPVLNQASPQFDEKLHNRIEELQKEWYANSDTRSELFKEYFKENKFALVDKK